MTAHPNGWERLSNGFDVEFRHAIPFRLSDNGRQQGVPDIALLDEITALGKLHVRLGPWQSGERPVEQEARLYVTSREFDELLRRLARASAAVFVDRYHKPLDVGDVDWDRLEYQKDFRSALDHCGLSPGDIDRDAWRDVYIKAMHSETRRLADQPETPPVDPE